MKKVLGVLSIIALGFILTFGVDSVGIKGKPPVGGIIVLTEDFSPMGKPPIGG